MATQRDSYPVEMPHIELDDSAASPRDINPLLVSSAYASGDGSEEPPLGYGFGYPSPRPHWRVRVSKWLTTMGPGIVVMLADTDAGCLITAAQSGAKWGYTLLGLQFILIVPLYMAQELTVRLGVITGQGHGELIKEHFGKGWAWLSVVTLVIACAGALVSEMTSVAGVGEMYGIPRIVSTGLCVAFLLGIVLTGGYRTVEKIAIGIGSFELVFVLTMIIAFVRNPDGEQLIHGLTHWPITDSGYLFLLAANVGAVIMPWMIFYQQSAVVDKKLTVAELEASRQDTLMGAVITQLIMASVLCTLAATVGNNAGDYELDNVQSIASALTPLLGRFFARLLLSLGMLGGAMVGAIVVSLTAAWGLGEVAGFKRSLEHSPKEAPWFYAVYGGVLGLAAIFTLSPLNVIDLNVAIEVMNAMLLPIVLGFLFLLAVRALPEEHRLKGRYMYLSAAVYGICALIGIASGIYGIALGTT
eukprot:TRINITY_DN26045_c0_g1_i1.p1 TRINITY_DN26045_c0_g1~~TRINITY_DN26045_c0_g1_i1.p1  ORF type:complete len:485 (+),score=80.60 TRINITY_DN26045_c0_g1_i1:41-1456(+)